MSHPNSPRNNMSHKFVDDEVHYAHSEINLHNVELMMLTMTILGQEVNQTNQILASLIMSLLERHH